MPTKERTARKKAKQGYLDGLEPPSIRAMDDAAEAYRETRNERMALTETEAELQAALLAVMTENKLKTYTTPDGFVCNIVDLQKVKVRKAKAESNGDGE